MKKRSISAVVDVLIIRLITIMAYCMTVSISGAVHNRVIDITTKRSIRTAVYLILLYIVVMLCIHFLYFFISEKKGNSIGKKLAQYEPAYGKTESRQAVRVALCKTGACILYVVTVPYFLFTGNMPYDKVRKDEYQCNRRMKETVGIIVDAKVISWIYMLGRPTQYIVKVEYYIDNEKISKTLVTSGKFAAKYERERDIQVVVIPNTGKVYFAEENWRMQNIGLIIPIMLIVFLLCFLILYFLF